MFKALRISIAVFFFAVIVTTPAIAGVERVKIAKVMDEQAIIVRSNGESYLIEKGIGCLSLWRFEGREVLIISPGLFLGVGSTLLIPELDQQCRIWNAKALGTAPLSPAPPPPPPRTADSRAPLVILIQRALALLGYDPGPLDGVLGAKTVAALGSYRESKGFPATIEGLALALTSLPLDLILKQADNLEALQVADALISALLQTESSRPPGPTAGSCLDGHWIASVTSDGRVVVLEDGSAWQVDMLDTIRTMLWLPVSRVTICGDRMINKSNGQTARVTRVH